jgi:hypothetical protein
MSRSYSGLRSGAINQTNAFHGQLSSLLSPVDGGNIPIFGKLAHVDPTFTGRIVSGDPSFNNATIHGKLVVNNYQEQFVTYEEVQPYTFSNKNNVIFCGNCLKIYLPEIVESGRVIQISNMTANTITMYSSLDLSTKSPENVQPKYTRIYHWMMTPSEGQIAFDVYPNMFIRIIYTKNPLTNVGKWSIMC